MSNLLDMVRSRQLRTDLPEIHPGDTVRVHARIVEGNKERVQLFEGVVIRCRKNKVDASITVRRVAHAVGVERTFMLHSPRVDRFEVIRRGRVRRAALYYLREREKRPVATLRGAAARQVAVATTPATIVATSDEA